MAQATVTDQDRRAAMYREADARFWAQTGYKVGKKLDPADPADAQMMSAWRQAYAVVADEVRRHGWFTPTHRSEAVTSPLAQAAHASSRANEHARAAADATATGAAVDREHHLAAAQLAHEESHAHSTRAAAAQPPSVDPATAHAAAERAQAENALRPAHVASAPELTEQQRVELARQAIANVLEAANAAKRATIGTGTSPAPASPPVAPKRDAAASPDGVAPGARPELDAQGRVIQPSASVSQGSRWWGVVAVGAVCAGAFAAAATLSMRKDRGGRRRRRSAPR